MVIIITVQTQANFVLNSFQNFSYVSSSIFLNISRAYTVIWLQDERSPHMYCDNSDLPN